MPNSPTRILGLKRKEQIWSLFWKQNIVIVTWLGVGVKRQDLKILGPGYWDKSDAINQGWLLTTEHALCARPCARSFTAGISSFGLGGMISHFMGGGSEAQRSITTRKEQSGYVKICLCIFISY